MRRRIDSRRRGRQSQQSGAEGQKPLCSTRSSFPSLASFSHPSGAFNRSKSDSTDLPFEQPIQQGFSSETLRKIFFALCLVARLPRVCSLIGTVIAHDRSGYSSKPVRQQLGPKRFTAALFPCKP